MKRTGAFRSIRAMLSARTARDDVVLRTDTLANIEHSACLTRLRQTRVNLSLTTIGKDRVVGLNTDAVSVC